VHNYQDSKSIDAKAFAKFFHNILRNGVYFPPSSVDAACVSAAHTEEEIEETVRICERAFQ
jgi:glutamate-1-semialdehyde 2,1-aminomutase